ncbi:hypothetical protein BCR44DRAFT_1438861 [Catenaria anguillulae PL171]|uniref:Uncharacterized protein n=1 Tax=Catenaria anguillulae PL171 TaxID=765915 RepID=A0A1Y2HEZ0_9FUNG|nr:hypothetical protein BCR44DRAFT_1438861 [Catenaria anguillulae PL171]
MVLVWITSAMATLVAFVAIMMIPGVARRMPALFLNALMTTVLKCFSAYVTLAIGSMTQLVLTHQG